MNDDILEKIKANGFKTAEEFVKANIHYLSENKKSMYYMLKNLSESHGYKSKANFNT